MKKTSLALALAAGLIAGPALAQSPAPQPSVSTAPTSRAPGGMTSDQGAGVPGASASPAAPAGTAGLPPSPQAGVPGTQAPSQLGR
jgi:SRSO17 transposase